jgi:hypothetical protein
MIELVADLAHRIVDASGSEYYVSVAAEQRTDGVWEAWLEYVPTDESDALVTPTETTQPSRADVERWAAVLTDTYVEGAFDRAMRATIGTSARILASRTGVDTAVEPAGVASIEAELPDPFNLYSDGVTNMRARLSVLPRSMLLKMIETFGLNPAGRSLAWLSNSQLVTFIMTAVEVQSASGTRSK